MRKEPGFWGETVESTEGICYAEPYGKVART